MKRVKASFPPHTQEQQPLYRSLVESLRREISAAGLEPKRLPTGQELCKKYGVSHMTVRRAMEVLSTEGLITRTPKRGTFVVPPQRKSLKDVAGSAVAINITYAPGTGRFISFELLGANDFLQRQKIDVVIREAPHSVDAARIFIDSLARSRMGGFLCHSFDETVMRAMVTAANAAGLPIVVLNDSVDDLSVDYVTCDNRAGGRIAAEYLLSLGHRRIAFLTQRDHATQTERWEALQQCVRRAGGETDLFLAWKSESELERLLADCLNFSAVFCGHDGTAAMLIVKLMSRGIRVPGDISVIGFDNSMTICEHAPVPITTIAQPAREMGERAAQLLYERMRGECGRDQADPASAETCYPRFRGAAGIEELKYYFYNGNQENLICRPP